MVRTHALRRFAVLIIYGALLVPSESASAADTGLTLAVDGRELPAGLLHAHESLAAAAGDLALCFPKWIPGTHAPAGRIVNLVGLGFRAGGTTLRWDRDEADPFRLVVHVPAGAVRVEADLTYIANHGDVSSSGVDVTGGASLGVVNWNCCVLYPEGRAVSAIPVAATLVLPESWRIGTALPLTGSAGGTWTFAQTALATLIDQPVIAGPELTENPLATTGLAAAVAVGSVDGAARRLDPVWTSGLAAAVRQAQLLCGPAHCPTYHWLFVLGDAFDDIGLEHADCSLCGLTVRAFSDPTAASYAERTLPVHELIHSWCGKHVRPTAMATAEFQSAQRTSLLWVYEGLTMYLGEVVAVRAGLATPAEFRAQLAADIHDLAHQRGRAWRSVEDTARTAWLQRDQGGRYADLRRGEDFYIEGELFWLEADLIIRSGSHGARSLDDFCRAFLGAPLAAGTALRTYGLDEVIAALQAVQPYDWRALVRARISEVRPVLDGSGYEPSGWRLTYASPAAAPDLDEGTLLDARQSLGCEFREGRVTGLEPGSPAAVAGLCEGDLVTRVNGGPFGGTLLETALVAAQGNGGADGDGKLVFIVDDGDAQRHVTVAWGGGPRHPRLERNANAPDLLGAILTARDVAP